jgi:hypothetical protein
MASQKPFSSCDERPKTPTQDIGNGKPKSLMKTTLENQRRPTTSHPPTTPTTTTRVHLTTTPTTTPARRMTRSPTKARNSKTPESNNKPPDLLQRMTYPASWTRVAS